MGSLDHGYSGTARRCCWHSIGLNWLTGDNAVCGHRHCPGNFPIFAALSFWFDDRVGLVRRLQPDAIWALADANLSPNITSVNHLSPPIRLYRLHAASLFVGNQNNILPWLTPLIAIVALICSNALWLLGSQRYSSTGH